MTQAFSMIDVGNKPATNRIAVATGLIYVGPSAFTLIRDRQLPKGDVLMLAEIAGIQGAKGASQLMPLCHPMGLDHVRVITELNENDFSIRVYCTTRTTAKTGVEMEALAGVNAALLTIWDLTKMVEADLRISDIRLLAKVGGKSGCWINPDSALVPEWVRSLVLPPAVPLLADIGVEVIVLSDRASTGVYEDKSGPVARQLLEAVGARVNAVSVIPDEPALLQAKIRSIKSEGKTRLIITSGGTGVSGRDSTPESVAEIADRLIPGIGELLRSSGAAFTPLSWSSRSIGATLGNILIITLPGNPKAVKEGIDVLLPLIKHLLTIMQGIES
ncbi:MAG: bifunctional molybdenum cofactor biosynthesis protein MoaC/MoaB [Rhodocyclaceae bacterium]|jgi:molybdenum cofactor biosynthesis protein MoaC|nr:bifunctional molybdenum cofactor biosynthesis protein MoaC/MoaB [Rhodocyclaceae bacterium]